MGNLTGVQFYNELLLLLGNRTTGDVPAASAVIWLNQAIDHISSPKLYRHRELQDTTTQTMVADQRLYTIAAATGVGTVAVDSVIIYDPSQTTQRQRLQPIRGRDMHEMSLVLPSSYPYAYSIWGATQLEVLPAPDANYATWTLSIRRIKKPALFTSGNLTSGSVTTPYDSVWDEVVMQGALWRGWRWLREWERAEQAKREFGQLVNETTERMQVEAEDYDFGPQVVVEEVM